MPRLIYGTLLLFAITTLTGCEKYALDRQMEEMCAKDGGIKVHETVTLPPEKFDQDGDPIPGKRSNLMEERLGSSYQLTHKTTYLKNGDPLNGESQLSRSEWKVIRVADQKTLVDAIVYGRTGGDFIAFAHPTSNGCPQEIGAPKAVIRAAFIKGEK